MSMELQPGEPNVRRGLGKRLVIRILDCWEAGWPKVHDPAIVGKSTDKGLDRTLVNNVNVASLFLHCVCVALRRCEFRGTTDCPTMAVGGSLIVNMFISAVRSLAQTQCARGVPLAIRNHITDSILCSSFPAPVQARMRNPCVCQSVPAI